MRKRELYRAMTIALVAFPLWCAAQPASMTFFITSVGSGKGADFGGIAGADKHCQTLATAAGAAPREWRAYLSTSASGSTPAVDARNRIGSGPWQNAKGVVIAKSLDELHGKNALTKESGLSEKGELVNGRGDTPNKHDILTGSRPDGTAFPAEPDMTCGNWTKSGEGSAMVGHHDRVGLSDTDAARSWNSSHATRGCSDSALVSTGGAGLIYCFAAK
ncbi:MAG TPA: hypothetical protein VNG69_11760 [Casimicrobiaceae bacterium]|nr:hypothetical protein [Casimicrobiaceae bacterium]